MVTVPPSTRFFISELFLGEQIMSESFKTKLMRWGFNFFPVFRRTGARFTYFSEDLHEVRLKLPLNWKTKNYIGTIYGGSIFSCADGLHVVMLIKILGRGYIVWDKEATIAYKKPGRSTLYATIKLGEHEIEEIKKELTKSPSILRSYSIDFVDRDNVVCASIQKTVYIRKT